MVTDTVGRWGAAFSCCGRGVIRAPNVLCRSPPNSERTGFRVGDGDLHPLELSASSVGVTLPDVTLYPCKTGYRKFTDVSFREKCHNKLVAIIGEHSFRGFSQSHVPSFVKAKEELELWVWRTSSSWPPTEKEGA